MRVQGDDPSAASDQHDPRANEGYAGENAGIGKLCLRLDCLGAT